MLSDGDLIKGNEIEAYQCVLAAADLGNQVALQMKRMMNPQSRSLLSIAQRS